ncbi:cytochrome d ubiquinol oxidase, subunit II [Propionibacterium acidifaciens F0233]|uniref:Cytochrome d ubiquinol oxidase, subunit II n=1 Tax=Propionibacterium acidifaciens F0233 TaxID=553198 RepID=U2RRY7_9ACTN|nr:cytochrome d ubiquinol oxidase subunit II [Propionibacterium acidifaciens]ERK56308.1 cytochrome d ubiquinol oxidase, subunit II [Propionibacterium acidifaciens F0233]
MLTTMLTGAVPLQIELGASPLQVVWFCLIALLWTGFFFLEGFDFGVAMLYPVLGRDPGRRRVMINTIGPTWDGNEVWLLTAGGGMFAAFPGWYSTLFSALYLPLFLVLVGLIARGVSFEYRAKMPDDRWRDAFDACASIGSLVVSLVLGIGFANFVRGLPVAPDPTAFGSPNLFTGGFWSLFNPFGLLGGALFVLLFCTHGAVFLALKTYGEVRERAMALLRTLGPVTVAVLAAFVVIACTVHGAGRNPYLGTAAGVVVWVAGLGSVLALAVAVLAQRVERNGWAFLLTGATIVALFVMIFTRIYGTLGFVPADMGDPLTMVTASSSPHTLRLMTIFAACVVPVVLAYQIWSYWVFHRRISGRELPEHETEPNEVATTIWA